MRRALILVALAGGCEKSDPPKPAPPPPPGSGHAVELITAKAFATDDHGVVGLSIRMSPRDETCASIQTRDDVLVIFVPPGPGDSYFLGQPIGVHANLASSELAGLPGPGPRDARVTVTKLEATTAVVDVDLDSDQDRGFHVDRSFDVELCDAPPRAGLAAVAPATPATGTTSDTGDITVGTVVARTEGGAVTRLDLYRDPDFGCTAIPGQWQITTYLPLSPVPGAPQPARMVTNSDVRIAPDWDLPGWARLDVAGPDALTVSVVIARDTGKALTGHLAGTLAATICPAS